MRKPGLLLINLGSPDTPSVPDVRRYLREFLMDGRVIDIPYPIRWAVVHGCILPSRPKLSAEAYRSIWTAQGSPLITISREVRDALKARLPFPVELAMRYQNPSVEEAVANLAACGVEELLVVPMFPHYAMSSYESAVERVKEVVAKGFARLKLTVAAPYFNNPRYIDALVASAEGYLADDYDHLLFSFHGLPERHLRKADPTHCHCLSSSNCCEVANQAHATCYRAQCLQTVRLFVEKAGVPQGKFSVAFQSRLGKDPWMQPYTDREIERLAQNGMKRLLVICPAFVSDCLETLEEIGMRGRESFLHSGGQAFSLIPCLNAHPLWLDALEEMALRLSRLSPVEKPVLV